MKIIKSKTKQVKRKKKSGSLFKRTKGKYIINPNSKAKRYTNLKDYLGEEKGAKHFKNDRGDKKDYKNRRGNRPQQGGNFQTDSKGFSKPVFTNSIKPQQTQQPQEDTEGIRNSNQEYTKKIYFSDKSERKPYNNNQENRSYKNPK